MRTIKVSQYEIPTEKIDSKGIMLLVMKFLKQAISHINKYDNAPPEYQDFCTLELLTIQKTAAITVSGYHLYSDSYGIILDDIKKIEVDRHIRHDDNTLQLMRKDGVCISDLLTGSSDLAVYLAKRYIAFYYPPDSQKLHG